VAAGTAVAAGVARPRWIDASDHLIEQGRPAVSTEYRKIAAARLDRVGDDFVLLRDDQPAAYTLSDSGAVLWEALDHFHRAEELASLLAEARPGLAAEAARAEVRRFLGSLVAHGLVADRRIRRVRKKDDIVVELVGNDLIVLSRSNRKVHLLNESGALLWEALEQFPDSAALQGLLAEAWPAKPADEVAEIVRSFLDQLVGLGLIEDLGD
jgi:hypothetical protein